MEQMHQKYLPLPNLSSPNTNLEAWQNLDRKKREGQEEVEKEEILKARKGRNLNTKKGKIVRQKKYGQEQRNKGRMG